jgi:hypothetical protein
MKMTSHTDLDAIGALSPRAVVAYLESKGWKRVAAYGEYGALVARTINDEKHELIVPTSPTTKDFVRTMSLFVSDLVEIEDRSPYDIIRDLGLAPYDVFHVRAPEADDLGSISLSAGVKMHEQARAVLAAAANAAAAPTPRAYWQGRPFERVDSYLNALRLGQTQRGSFVLSLLSPWDFEPNISLQTSLLLDDVPFGRSVTRTLARTFIATRRALSEAVSADVSTAFMKAVPEGVSINLCDALATLIREGDGIDLSINWSLTKPENEVLPLRLRREDAQTLTEARQMLAKNEPSPDTSVEGVILQITNDQTSFDGSVVILAPVNGAIRKVRTTFLENDRKTVFEAGQQKQGIRVVGQLARHGRWLQLENPHDLSLISTTDDEGEEESVAGYQAVQISN